MSSTPPFQPVEMPSGAVFLSYASQDAESARQIAEALPAGGIEVRFDQSELRGGDAWDANIRSYASQGMTAVDEDNHRSIKVVQSGLRT